MAIGGTGITIPMIGELRSEVTVQKFILADDGYGGQTTTWENVTSMWARITPATADEEFQAGIIQQEVTHWITLRHLPIIQTGWRLVYLDPDVGTRTFYVVTARDLDDSRRFTVIQAKEEKA